VAVEVLVMEDPEELQLLEHKDLVNLVVVMEQIMQPQLMQQQEQLILEVEVEAE
tara:strand:+ start:381 stop:542 length:162 start_codon:yes stop_codon:yes gene_type:complete